MPELEKRIADWRLRMMAAMPHRDEAVAELEGHLREDLAELQRAGKSDDEAFALAEERLGRPNAIAREFGRMPGAPQPGIIILPALGLLLAFIMGVSLWSWSRRPPVRGLDVVYLVHMGAYLAGAFGVLGSGLIAASAYVTTWGRPLGERERHAVRQRLKTLAWFAVVLLPIGMLLRSLWFASLSPNQWPLSSFHLRAIGPIVSVALLFFAQSRPSTSDRGRWLAAIFASLVVVLWGLKPRLAVADIPMAWLCAVFHVGQIFLLLPRFRIVRIR